MREQLIAVGKIIERHRLFAERVNDMAVIDDVAALFVGDRPPAFERHHRRRAEKAFEPAVVDPHTRRRWPISLDGAV